MKKNISFFLTMLAVAFLSAWITLHMGNGYGPVDPTSPPTYRPPERTARPTQRHSLVGMRCVITVSSGRARSGPGTSYPIVEYVGKGREFTIGDVRSGTDGKPWYQIVEGGNVCWISSGIAKVEGYGYQVSTNSAQRELILVKRTYGMGSPQEYWFQREKAGPRQACATGEPCQRKEWGTVIR